MDLRSKIIACIAVLVALWGLHEYDKSQALSVQKNEYVKASKDVKERAERATQALDASHRKELKDKNEKLEQVSTSLTIAISKLQHRSIRPSIVTVTETRESCTGSQLYREDAEFLTREASRAETVIVERDYYYNEYEKARLKLEELNDQQRTDVR